MAVSSPRTRCKLKTMASRTKRGDKAWKANRPRNFLAEHLTWFCASFTIVTSLGHEANKNYLMNEPNTAKNVLTSAVEIKGNLKFTGELAFDGKLDGEIHTDGVLNLGDSAVINGNIGAQSVVVRGKVTGNITAKEKIDIKAKAELFGDIRSAKLTIEEGVTFVGKTEVNPNKVAPTPPPVRPTESPKSPETGKPPGR
jgi:cytoskeletal protein CcmA (bactofilin family)